MKLSFRHLKARFFVVFLFCFLNSNIFERKVIKEIKFKELVKKAGIWMARL